MMEFQVENNRAIVKAFEALGAAAEGLKDKVEEMDARGVGLVDFSLSFKVSEDGGATAKLSMSFDNGESFSPEVTVR